MQTLGWRDSNVPGGIPGGEIPRVFPTKVIRILSLAPNLSKQSSASGDTDEPSAVDSASLGGPGPNLPSSDAWRTQAGLLQLLSVLSNETDLEQSDGEDEWESMDEDEEEDEEEEEE